ncbi:MAG: DMT family transporter [Desulfobacterota bacterium]|nr:DMT family transporter [Thermodesulfobacteriota bacterium]
MSWQAFTAVVIWGFSFIATKVALRELHPFTLLTLRYGIGALVLLGVQLSRDRDFLKRYARRDWGHLFLLAATGVSGLGLLQAYGLLHTTAMHTGWIIAINPILILILARFFLGEGITFRKVVGIVLGFFGVFLIISKGVFSLDLLRFASTYGDLLILASALAWSGFTVAGKGFISRFPPLATVTTLMLVGCLLVLPPSLLKGDWGNLFSLSGTTWAGLLFLGIFCSGLGYLLWYAALEKKDSGAVGMYLYLEPFATLIGASLYLAEPLEWMTLAGGTLVLGGVALATGTRDRTRKD